MIKNITNKLKTCPSYFRWSTKRLATYFGCSERTINRIKTNLESTRLKYEASL